MVAEFNLDNWPMAYVKFTNCEMTDEIFDEYKRNYLNMLIRCKNNKEKIILICDLDHTQNMPLNYLMKQTQFNKEVEKFNKEYVRCVCIMCKNKGFKNMLNLYFSVSKPASPFKIFRSTEKANKYINDKFNIKFDINKLYDKKDTDEDLQEEEEEEKNEQSGESQNEDKKLY